MTKRIKLLIGTAVLAVSSPAIAQAQQCVWAKPEIYGTYSVNVPSLPAKQIIGVFYNADKFKPYHAYCSYEQFERQFFQENGGVVEAYGQGSKLVVPVPVRLTEAAPTPAPAPTQNPAPAPTFSTQSGGGAMQDAEIAELKAELMTAKMNGSNPVVIDELIARIAALEARQATAGQTIVEKPIYTTKTVVQGMTAADKQQLDKATAAIQVIEAKPAWKLTDEEIEQYRKWLDLKTGIEAKYSGLKLDLVGDGKKDLGRMGRAEKRLDALEEYNFGGVPWYVWLAIGLVGIIALVALFRPRSVTRVIRADRLEREAGVFNSYLGQRELEIEIRPANLEQRLDNLKVNDDLQVKLCRVDGTDAATFDCTKLKWSKVRVDGSQPLDVRDVRAYLIQEYNAGRVNGA